MAQERKLADFPDSKQATCDIHTGQSSIGVVVDVLLALGQGLIALLIVEGAATPRLTPRRRFGLTSSQNDQALAFLGSERASLGR